jgi:hypothetical protein
LSITHIAGTTRRLARAGAIAAGTLACTVGAVAVTAGVASADTLPAYTANGFCVTLVANLGQPTIYKKECTGEYKVTRATYQFTQDATGICPALGVMVELDETWISPPTGGSPTILVSYHAHLG